MDIFFEMEVSDSGGEYSIINAVTRGIIKNPIINSKAYVSDKYVRNNPVKSGPISLLNCHRNDSIAFPLTMNSLPRISSINILLEGKSITTPMPWKNSVIYITMVLRFPVSEKRNNIEIETIDIVRPAIMRCLLLYCNDRVPMKPPNIDHGRDHIIVARLTL